MDPINDELFEKYRAGKSSEQEDARMEAHLFDAAGSVPLSPEQEAESDMMKLRALTGLVKRMDKQRDPRKATLYIQWIKYISAASFILISTFFLHRFLAKDQLKDTGFVRAISDVAPGRNQAYLTLADGSKISLDDSKAGTIAQQGGTVINKTGNGSLEYQPGVGRRAGLNTVSTPMGGQYRIVLPDGSKVWLNAASSLTFPNTFNDAEAREVSITGEAYFEVAKDHMRPFIVKNSNQKIEVLGTRFNVNTYNDEPAIRTTLVDGSVRVSGGGAVKILKPGQQSALQGTDLSVSAADMTATAWKDGVIRFRDQDLKSILRQIYRWYDVEIVYEGKISDALITGGMSREASLQTVLSTLKEVGVKFSLEETARGKRLVVKGN